MGIHGVFKEINASAKRISLAKYSADFLATHNRPLILAIDIAIWLFQIQSGKGGSNPALRTFYYRLLRLISLNIWPVFVFDGPHKPTWKRNKKVGGPGVRVVSVPEFLAKELLRKFGFPVHIAPGEAEAECALLQKEGIVDAVMSEDVDTLMFGSGVLLRNWSPEGSTKTPTHVTVYTKEDIAAQTRLDPAGMTLVALMSGGDYIVEGIPGCGPKVACDAARAGFGRELCALARSKDTTGLREWRERLQHEVRTNASKFFSRKNSSLIIPDDFPNLEVLGYYTHPRVSGRDALDKLRREMRWDRQLAFQELREFTKDAFDWRCLGGAKKFIRNLAPALLIRELRVRSQHDSLTDTAAQEALERTLIAAVHGKRNHITTDGELEYRVSFIPQSLVPIDLSIEEPDEEDTTATAGLDSDIENEDPALQIDAEDGQPPASPTKRRALKPYHPDQPEKLWVIKSFLQMGSPLLIEDFEAGLRAGKTKKNAGSSAAGAQKATGRVTRQKKKADDMPRNALMAYASITKVGVSMPKPVERIDISEDVPADHAPVILLQNCTELSSKGNEPPPKTTRFRKCIIPTLQPALEPEAVDLTACENGDTYVPGTQSPAPSQHLQAISAARNGVPSIEDILRQTPKKRNKRILVPSPSPARSQKTIESYWSPSRDRRTPPLHEIIDLLSSSPVKHPHHSPPPRLQPQTPSPVNLRTKFIRCSDPVVYAQSAAEPDEGELLLPFPHDASTPPANLGLSRADSSPGIDFLPASVTQRSKKRQRTAARCGRGVLERISTAPVYGCDADDDDDEADVVDHELPQHHHRPASDDLDQTTPKCLDDLLATGINRPAAAAAARQTAAAALHVDLTSSSSPHRGSAITLEDERQDDDGDDLPEISSFALLPVSSSSRTRPGLFSSMNGISCCEDGPVLGHDAEPFEPPWAAASGARSNASDVRTDSSVADTLVSAAPVGKVVRKRVITLRESLPGAFRERDDERVVETPNTRMDVAERRPPAAYLDTPPPPQDAPRDRRRRWRKSGVEVLDLTLS